MELPRLWLWSPHLVKISEIWYKEKVLQHWDTGVLFLTQMQGVATVTRNPYQLRMCNYLSSQQTWSPLCTTYPYACRYAHQYTYTCTYWYAYGYSLGTVDLGTNTNLPEYAVFTETGNLFSKHQISMKVNWRIFHHLCWDKKTHVKYWVQFLVHACSIAYVTTMRLCEIAPISMRYFAFADATTREQCGALRVSAHSRYCISANVNAWTGTNTWHAPLVPCRVAVFTAISTVTESLTTIPSCIISVKPASCHIWPGLRDTQTIPGWNNGSHLSSDSPSSVYNYPQQSNFNSLGCFPLQQALLHNLSLASFPDIPCAGEPGNEAS